MATAMAAAVPAGCASGADRIRAAYVSQVTDNNFSCSELAEEASRANEVANEVAGVQDEKATHDAVATGVALALFWPAVFMIRGDGATAGQLASLRGQLQAIEQQSIAKRSGIEFRREPARKTVAS